jgi:hypothetical protein
MIEAVPNGRQPPGVTLRVLMRRFPVALPRTSASSNSAAAIARSRAVAATDETPRPFRCAPSMPRRLGRSTTPKQNGLVYVWGWIERQRVISPAFTKRKRLLSPDQYEIVDVRTSRGVRRAMLFPKAILQDEFETNREVLAIKRERWRVKRAQERGAAARAANKGST